MLPEFLHQFNAAFVRHLLVKQDNVDFVAVQQLNGFFGRCCFFYGFDADLIEGVLDECSRELIIIDN